MENISIDKKIVTYFRSNIFEAFSAYNGWKMLAFSKSYNVVPRDLAEKYVKIQSGYASFFITAERSFLVNFILTVLHPFDKRDDSYSLYKVNAEKASEFEKNNQLVIDELRNVRNKIFAHKDFDTDTTHYKIPAINRLDPFFNNLIEFYNELTAKVEDSSTSFSNVNQIKHETESLFMDLYMGSMIRKEEIKMDWEWKENSKKASDVL